MTNWPLPYSLVSPVRPYCDELTSTIFSCQPSTTLLWRIDLYHILYILMWAHCDLIMTNYPLPCSLVSPVRPYCDELTSTIFSCQPIMTLLWRIDLYHILYILMWAHCDLIMTNLPLPYSLVSPVRPYCDELTSTMFSCEPIATLLWRIDRYHILL